MRSLPLLRLTNGLVLADVVQLLRTQRTARIGRLNRLPLLVKAGPRIRRYCPVEERTLRLAGRWRRLRLRLGLGCHRLSPLIDWLPIGVHWSRTLRRRLRRCLLLRYLLLRWLLSIGPLRLCSTAVARTGGLASHADRH
jgi:hypothetical protein